MLRGGGVRITQRIAIPYELITKPMSLFVLQEMLSATMAPGLGRGPV